MSTPTNVLGMESFPLESWMQQLPPAAKACSLCELALPGDMTGLVGFSPWEQPIIMHFWVPITALHDS